MRLGGPVLNKYNNPSQWIKALRSSGYRAAYCPVGLESNPGEVLAYAGAAKKAGILIAEVGAWSNPLSLNENEKKAAFEKSVKSLALADEIGARCCVNTAGIEGFNDETFEIIVESVRKIIDAVSPSRTFYTLETMGSMYPNSADSSLRLVRAVDRPSFAIHFDPANIICTPRLYLKNKIVIKDFIRRAGHLIRSCHAKDIIMKRKTPPRMEEVPPGKGKIDYPALIRELDKVDPGMPVMLEHLRSGDEYREAASYLENISPCLKKIGDNKNLKEYK